MTEKIKWRFVQKISVAGITCEEYVSEDERIGRIVYNDGYEEIYEIAKKETGRAKNDIGKHQNTLL